MSLVAFLRCDVPGCGNRTEQASCNDRAVRDAIRPYASGWNRVRVGPDEYHDLCPTCAAVSRKFRTRKPLTPRR